MAGESGSDAALRRVLAMAEGGDLLELLTRRLDGSDLITLLLEVMRRRAADASPAGVMRRYASDHFVVPGQVPFGLLRTVEDGLLAALGDDSEIVVLSPLAPLGAHSSVALVDQNNVVSTVRMSEVAADPTNALPLEAAHRRVLISGVGVDGLAAIVAERG